MTQDKKPVKQASWENSSISSMGPNFYLRAWKPMKEREIYGCCNDYRLEKMVVYQPNWPRMLKKRSQPKRVTPVEASLSC